jgi:hypothetical protein
MSKEAPPGVQEMFAAALRHHQAGHLSEAERLYRQVLLADSHHADALHFLGVLAHQAGRNEAAVDMIGKASSARYQYRQTVLYGGVTKLSNTPPNPARSKVGAPCGNAA